MTSIDKKDPEQHEPLPVFLPRSLMKILKARTEHWNKYAPGRNFTVADVLGSALHFGLNHTTEPPGFHYPKFNVVLEEDMTPCKSCKEYFVSDGNKRCMKCRPPEIRGPDAFRYRVCIRCFQRVDTMGTEDHALVCDPETAHRFGANDPNWRGP